MQRRTFLLLATVASAPALADRDHDLAYRLREQQQILPLRELISKMGIGEGARLLELESKERDGRRLYEVEYVDERGQVHELLIDARTGEVLRREK